MSERDPPPNAEPGSRDAVLDAVRRALARQAPAPEAAPHDATAEIRTGVERLTPATPAGLADQFRRELEALGAELVAASSPGEAAALLGDRLEQAGVRRAAVADHESVAPLLGPLAAAGLELHDPASRPPAERRTLLADLDAGLTAADFALADTGTLVFTPATLPDRLVAVLPRCHVAVLRRSRLLPHLWALLEPHAAVADRPLYFVTGPSRTADIEKQLVLGAHGPARLVVVMIG